MDRNDDWQAGFLAGYREGKQAGIERKRREVTVKFAPMSPMGREALAAVLRRYGALIRSSRLH